MTAPEKLYTPQGEVEARMGLIPLEELHQERDELVSQIARLRATYGPGGTFEALRKIELSKAAAVVRAQATLEGKKVTEAYLDEMAHCSDGYIQFITQATTDRADWIVLEERITSIEFTIQRGQCVGRFLAAEAGLAR